MRIRQRWLTVFLLLGTAAFFLYKDMQQPLTYHFAEDFDGNDYEHIYNFFVSTEVTYIVPFPFNQRILVPYLSAQINSGDIINDFQWVNFSFSLLSILLLFYLWRILGFDLKWAWFGFIWLLFHWSGLIRLNSFDPITVDVPLYIFQALFLILILKRKFIHLLWLAPLATAQKESFVALVFILNVYALWYNRTTKEGYYELKFIFGGLFLSVLTQFIINHYFPSSIDGKGALITIAYQVKEAILNPFEIIRWLAAISMAFGPAIWIAVIHYKKSYRFDNRRNILLLFTGLYFSFGILAGGDMTRIVFLGFPFIMTWIIYELKDLSKYLSYWLLGLSFPLFMLHANIPDPAWERALWESWYPEFSSSKIVGLILIYTFTISILLLKKLKVSSNF